MLPVGDKTPDNWVLPSPTLSERIKRVIRKFAYPSYLWLINLFLRRRFDPDNRLGIDQWYWGTRGLEYERLRAKLERIAGIRGKRILIAGCGTGRDISSWYAYHPKEILGVDYFSYDRAWKVLCDSHTTATRMTFMQGDLASLAQLPSASFDIVGSDAVFEHLKNLPDVLREFNRVLKDGGVIYATFGPLWYCWGGDHVSGYDSVRNGYNHLLLTPADYQSYLSAYGEYAHSEDDGRTWVEHGLFSYLRPAEYLSALEEAGFGKLHVGMVIEPRAIRCFREYPEIKQRIKGGVDLDGLVAGMSVIFRKTPA